MPNITLSIPAELYAWMNSHPEYKWSEVARQAFRKKMKEAELVEDLKAIAKGEKEIKAGKVISFEKLVKKLGLENEI